MKNITLGVALALSLSTSLAVAGGNVDAGKQKSTTCAGCHGAEGISTVTMYPNIGGQYRDYLLHSLRAYKSGDRENAIMQGMVASLSDQDMQDLAAYFSSLPGALKNGSVEPD
jgi:cytochrome c553